MKKILTALLAFYLTGIISSQAEVKEMDSVAAFRAQLAGASVMVADFYATWCPPCKKLSPLLEDLASKYKGKIIFYKVDVDAEHQLAQSMGITSMPTLLFIPVKGQPQLSVGLVPNETLEKMIHEILLVN